MTQHTPGPCAMCHADTGQHPAGSTFRREPCGCEVAGVGLLPNPWHVHYCPTHAAAPDLLAALQEVVSFYDDLRVKTADGRLLPLTNHIVERWRASIRKATGPVETTR